MDSRQDAVQTVTIIFLCLSSAFVFFRFLSRTLIVRHVLVDDWIILFAWLLSFGFSFSILWAVRNGLGLHNVDIPLNEILPLRKAEYAFSVLYNPVLMATKSSILVFYIRNLFALEKVWKVGAYVVLLVVNVAGLALTLVNIFQCAPLSAVFDAVVPSATCSVDLVVLYLASAPVNILTDLAILVLPLPVLSRMRMTGKAKGILLATFSAGAFVAVVDVIRIASLETAYEAQLAAKTSGGMSMDGKELLGQDDFSYYGALSFMWSAVEIHIGIMCACVPSLKPLAARFIPKLIHETGHGHASRSKSHNDEKGSGGGVVPVQNENEAMVGPVEAPRSQEDDVSDSDSMDMATFLSRTAGHADGPSTSTNTSRDLSRRDTLLTFYDVHRSKVLTELSTRRSILPIAQVTLLFFLWGVSYGFLTNLNSQFQVAVNQTAGQAVSIHAAYYAAYFFSPLLFGRWILKRWGFKATFITGLWIYAVGTLIFWPSAVLYSFPAFVISNFVVGMGVSTLEVGANIFLALCGPMEYAEVRLNLSQAVQGIGTVFATTLAQKVLFKNVSSGTSLLDVQWTYLAITFVDVILSVAFYYMIVPEVSDAQLEELALSTRGVKDEIEPKVSPSSSPSSSKTLTPESKKWLSPTTKIAILGCIAIFLYVSAQECLAYYFKALVSSYPSNLDPADFLSLGTATFAIGRFLTAGFLFLAPPRVIILILLLGTALFAALSTFLPSTSSAMPACLILMDLFEGGLFPTIFANTLRGQGSRTKDVASYLVAATSGGAIGPAIMYGISIHGSTIQLSFVTSMACALAALVYPVFVSGRSMRRVVDPDPKPVFGTSSLVFAVRYTWRETLRLIMWPRRASHQRGYEHAKEKGEKMQGRAEHVERREVSGSEARDHAEKTDEGATAELTLGLGLDLGIGKDEGHEK